MRIGVRGWLLAVAFVAVAVSGCGEQAHARINVTPAVSLLDQPVRIAITGVGARRLITVQMRSVDANGVTWSSHATFRSSSSGAVSPSDSPSVSGSYRGVDAMGLVDALSPDSSSETSYFWQRVHPQQFNLRVLEGGHLLAKGVFRRRVAAPGVTFHQESIAATGFDGEYVTPAPGGPARPAVLVFGGSEGGLSGQPLIAGALAAAGYPALALAYFAEPGLPRQLKDIPLGYFARALRWLGRQPGVRSGQIDVAGASRGSEAALLLGVHYPNLVHGVIASSPSDLSFGSYPAPGSPAWTFDNRPVPYSHTFSATTPITDPAAQIAVQRIRGPILLDCGTDDQLWTSCAYAQAIQHRLSRDHDRFPHVLYRYLGAGHGVNFLIPYQPGPAAPTNAAGGDSAIANPDADTRLWTEILRFLARRDVPTGTFTASTAPRSATTP